jgi:hypothetical protein
VRIFIAANGESEKAKALLSTAYPKIFSGPDFEPRPHFYPDKEVESCDEARKLVLSGVGDGNPYSSRKLSYDALVISEDRDVGGYELAGIVGFSQTMKPRKLGVLSPKDRVSAYRAGAHPIRDLPSAEAFLRGLRDLMCPPSGPFK